MQTTVPDETAGDGACERRRWCLTVVHHPNPDRIGSRRLFEVGEAIVIGRDGDGFPGAIYDDDRLSRHHARITCEPPGFKVADLSSANGTFIGGRRVDEGRAAANTIVGAGSLLFYAHRRLEQPPPNSDVFHGTSDALTGLLESIAAAAADRKPALIIGETGSGKELAAIAIHAASNRPGRLVPLSCPMLDDANSLEAVFGREVGSAIEPGFLERADGGTLFLDHVGDAGDRLQASLLRFFDEGLVVRRGAVKPIELDVRIIGAATDEPTALRPELGSRFERRIRVPQLRARVEDIPHIARAHLRGVAAQTWLHHRFALSLLRYRWPGNVRELRSILDIAVAEWSGDGALRAPPGVAARLDPDRASAGPPDALVVAADGSWFRPPGGTRVEVGHRPALAAILTALVVERQSEMGKPLTTAELYAVGWQDEPAVGRSGANRVYVALAALRKLGLRELLHRDQDGYLLDDAIPLSIRDR